MGGFSTMTTTDAAAVIESKAIPDENNDNSVTDNNNEWNEKEWQKVFEEHQLSIMSSILFQEQARKNTEGYKMERHSIR